MPLFTETTWINRSANRTGVTVRFPSKGSMADTHHANKVAAYLKKRYGWDLLLCRQSLPATR